MELTSQTHISVVISFFILLLFSLYVSSPSSNFSFLSSVNRDYFQILNSSSLNPAVSNDSIQIENTKLKNESNLKIYIYDLPSEFNTDFIKRDPRCLHLMFASEIYIHKDMLSSSVRTSNASEADWFYIPVYSTAYIHPQYLFCMNIQKIMEDAITYVMNQWPFWNRTMGADHFVVAPHDYGACFHYINENASANGIIPLLNRSTIVQTFGHRHHTCMKKGSIVIPPYVDLQKMKNVSFPPNSTRDIFVFFQGSLVGNGITEAKLYSQGVRQAIWERFHNHSSFSINRNASNLYYEYMHRSIFCLCPLGYAPWTPRITEAITLGCIPVIIADDIVLPFEKEIPWLEFAVFIPQKDALNLDMILKSISKEEIQRRQKVMSKPKVKFALCFPSPAQPGDAFHHVLRELAWKLPHPNGTFLESVV